MYYQCYRFNEIRKDGDDGIVCVSRSLDIDNNFVCVFVPLLLNQMPNDLLLLLSIMTAHFNFIFFAWVM